MVLTNSPQATATDLTTAPRAVDGREAPDATSSSHRTGPEAMRVLVRLLARQAAAEAWQAHLNAASRTP